MKYRLFLDLKSLKYRLLLDLKSMKYRLFLDLKSIKYRFCNIKLPTNYRVPLMHVLFTMVTFKTFSD